MSEQRRIGLHPGLSRAAYDAIDAVNVSRLIPFDKSARYALWSIQNPSPPTADMIFGTAFHCAVLEPERFEQAYGVEPPGDGRTTEVKEARAKWRAEHPGIIDLSEGEMKAINGMRESVASHPFASKLLFGEGGYNEVGMLWRDEETGMLCKGLLDRLAPFGGWTWIVDLKSCADARRVEFRRSVRRLHYGPRAAFYLDGCNTAKPRQRRFVWIAVEKTPPYDLIVYEAEDDAIEAGRSRYRRWLRQYAEAVESGVWPGYPDDVQPLGAEDTDYRA